MENLPRDNGNASINNAFNRTFRQLSFFLHNMKDLSLYVARVVTMRNLHKGVSSGTSTISTHRTIPD